MVIFILYRYVNGLILHGAAWNCSTLQIAWSKLVQGALTTHTTCESVFSALVTGLSPHGDPNFLLGPMAARRCEPASTKKGRCSRVRRVRTHVGRR